MLIPDKTSEDLLSRKSYSKIIVEYIISRKTETPFNIGIFGEWGEGKSSFLNLIEEEINKANRIENNEESYHTHVVRYDATEYSEQEKIWACILKQLFKKFEDENGYKARIKFSWKKFMKRLNEDIWKYIIRVISIVLIVIWWCIFNYQVVDLSKTKEVFLYGSLGIFPLIMGFVNIIIPFIKSQITIAKPLSDTVVTNMELPNYSKDLGAKESIKEDLMDLLDVWLKKQKNTDSYKERLVIFIDELDRCSEEGIVELLEALQLFLSVEQIVIVISINFNSICYALMKKMDYLNKDGVMNGNKIKFCINYLEKYINIPFYLNYVGKYDEYINRLLDNSKIDSNDRIVVIDEVAVSYEEEFLELECDNKFVFDIEERNIIREILNQANNLEHITPRAVKRIINILILSKQICMSINERPIYLEKIQFNNYIRWFIFAYFNPKTSFNLLNFTIRNKYYHTIESALRNITEQDKEYLYVAGEASKQSLISFLMEVKINEIRMFKDISNYFILDENRFIK